MDVGSTTRWKTRSSRAKKRAKSRWAKKTFRELKMRADSGLKVGMTAEAMAMDAPDFSIVIPVYNEAAIIEGSVRELCARVEKFSKRYEVIIAENGSKDETAAIAHGLTQDLPRVR